MTGGKERIIDVAEKYGYQSPTAFNRAFQSFHEIAPSAVRSEGVSVKSFSPIIFSIAVKGTVAIFSGTGISQSIQELEKRINKSNTTHRCRV